jgi:hypothetical protein
MAWHFTCRRKKRRELPAINNWEVERIAALTVLSFENRFTASKTRFKSQLSWITRFLVISSGADLSLDEWHRQARSPQV